MQYFGGVSVGKHVSVTELLQLYHAVVLAYGAEGDWKLGIPGEVRNWPSRGDQYPTVD